jgi:hypothetical protein
MSELPKHAPQQPPMVRFGPDMQARAAVQLLCSGLGAAYAVAQAPHPVTLWLLVGLCCSLPLLAIPNRRRIRDAIRDAPATGAGLGPDDAEATPRSVAWAAAKTAAICVPLTIVLIAVTAWQHSYWYSALAFSMGIGLGSGVTLGMVAVIVRTSEAARGVSFVRFTRSGSIPGPAPAGSAGEPGKRLFVAGPVQAPSP